MEKKRYTYKCKNNRRKLWLFFISAVFVDDLWIKERNVVLNEKRLLNEKKGI